MRPTDPIIADLRPAFRGELFHDAVTCGVYATDASPFFVSPLLVAVPIDEDDVVTIIRYAIEHGLSIQPRGAGSGLSGESLGAGITLDLSVHFRGLPRIEGDRIRVLPGITPDEVNSVLALRGRRLAPVPANGSICTIGGMIATDASGSTAASFGTTRDHVDSLSVIWDSGDRDDLAAPTSIRTQTIVQGLTELLNDRSAIISEKRTLAPFDRCGYHLRELITPSGIDLSRILVGSEGTLGIITEAVLKTIPIPAMTMATIIGFASIDDAARAGVAIRSISNVVSCDLLDRRLVALGRGVMIPVEIESLLIVVIESDSDTRARDTGREIEMAGDQGRVLVSLTSDRDAINAIHGFRRSALAGLYALRAGPRTTAIVDDIGIPPANIPAFLARLQPLLRSRDLTASILIHCPMGAVHLLPFVDMDKPHDRDRLWPLADELYALVREFRGTISVQHGVGISRTPWVRSQVSELADVYRDIKQIFDPRSLFNPGKIVGPDPTRPAWPLRPLRQTKPATPLLIWSNSPSAEANQCNDCGDCRPRIGPERMCPVFSAKPIESATPRAKANLIRLLDDPDLAEEREAIRDVAKLCTNCKMCRAECKSGVDIPKLMLETKAMVWRDFGTTRVGWFLARAESLLGLASRFTFISNTILGTRIGRWLLEKSLGLDRSIRLPALRYRTFIWRAWTRGWTRRPKNPTSQRFVLFVDPLTNASDPLTGESTVAVLKHHGVDVVVVPKVRPTGLSALTAGDVESARETARRTVRMLADFVRDGYRVVCIDPASTITITQEYPSLLSDADTKTVAANTLDIMSLLRQWHDRGELKTDFRDQDLAIGRHIPCHSKVLSGFDPHFELLNLIPGFRVTTIDAGCSGMMGPWGLLQQHRADSIAIGRRMSERLDDREIQYGASECGACRIQMQEATGKRAVHPIQYFAMAYGLVPEIGRRLVVPLSPLVSR